MSWNQDKITKTLNEAIQKASKDSAFRETLKNTPKETLEELSGLDIPSSIRLKVVDLNESDIIITLPKSDESELSDADLEQVSGGKGLDSVVCSVVAYGFVGGAMKVGGFVLDKIEGSDRYSKEVNDFEKMINYNSQ